MTTSPTRHKPRSHRLMAVVGLSLLAALVVVGLPAFGQDDDLPRRTGPAKSALPASLAVLDYEAGQAADAAQEAEAQSTLNAMDDEQRAALSSFLAAEEAAPAQEAAPPAEPATPPAAPMACSSFASQEEATAWLQANAGSYDMSALDSNADGVPCTAYFVPEPAPSAAPSAAAAPAAGGSVWDSMAQCESGGNWGTSTGNGYSGGLQFSSSTWQAYGGGAYAPTAAQAGRDAQIAVAEQVLASQGWSAWPGCSSSLGLG